MSLISILGIAIALAMDAFAVAIAVGISLKTISARQTFRLSWHFGLFQAMMPIIGWALGSAIHNFVESWAHWIAFGLLAAVGTNMLREAFDFEKDTEAEKKDSTRGLTMVMLSVATSIDALAVGFSMSMLEIDIVTPAIIIGIVAAAFTITGMHLGKKVASFKKLSVLAEILGGAVLWGIGLNILHQQGVFETFLFS
ncbi:manganese efflux pump MntP family protein [Desulfosediminicola ganghwensis]|uniref:manganese efflux pump MntP n=1 Tax=Desulfosediminicola ganghwensis TaxID=2569540 RepID=UPI0010AD252D|nr:manganese efflux pump MntP family protein [Desulfosediminicola ganghwensis]